MQLFQAWTNIKDKTPPHPTTFCFVFNFIPWPELEASTIKYQILNKHHTNSDVISSYRVYEIICVINNSWHKSEKSGHGYNVLLAYHE